MKKMTTLILSLALLAIMLVGCSKEADAPKSDADLLKLAAEAAKWIAENPDADQAALQELCDKLGVDDVCFVDANGVIALSNEADVVGYDLNNDEQSQAFLPLLSGDLSELVQEPTARGVDGETWQFAAVSGGLEGGLTQIGMKVE
ncbi:MAG TPA: hypothetical protein VJZ01_11930 [Lachnospiraceae bacterium]|nr:hypothetical protein [Lachnospiraceae bacterium]